MPNSRRQPNIFATVLGSMLSCAMLTQAAPLTRRSDFPAVNTPSTTDSTSDDTSGGAPYQGGATYTGPDGDPGSIAQIFPNYTSQFNTATGAVDFHTSQGLVYRSITDGGADITTLVTFELPAKYSSNWCQIAFTLEDAASWATGSLQAQLFTSLAPATTDASSWPSGNLRDQDLGSIDIVVGGEASFQAGSGPAATSDGFFPCSLIAGQVYGGEIVPQDDAVEISWPAGGNGIKIIVY